MNLTISNTLKDLGISPGLLGYRYLRSAVKLVMDNPDIVDRITKELYPKVAELNGTTPTRVERAIRHAIEHAWDNFGYEAREAIFRGSYSPRTGKPTNGEFIATVADYLLITQEDGHGS